MEEQNPVLMEEAVWEGFDADAVDRQLRLYELRRELRESGEPLLEALEDLLTATSLTGLLTAVVRQARALREVLRERVALRLQIAETEKEE